MLEKLFKFLGIYKEIHVEKKVPVYPTESFKKGDKVFVNFVNKLRRGTVLRNAYFNPSLFGGVEEVIPVEFEDGTIEGVWPLIIHQA